MLPYRIKMGEVTLKRVITYLLIMFTISCSSSTIEIEIETEYGSIFTELYPDQAPKTVANFMAYVDSNRYENSTFYRVTTPENEADREYPIEVIQGGGITSQKYYPPIEIETTNETQIKHVNGALSMARGKPNTATSHFFICINDQPELDHAGKRNPDGFGFAAFGKVTQGMDIVKKIHAMENERQYLAKPVLIKTIKRK